MSNPQDLDRFQTFDPKHLGIKSRISCKECMHNQSSYQTCYRFIDFITQIIVNTDQQNHPNLKCSEFQLLILCKHCVTTFISNSVFMIRWNQCLTNLQQNISKQPSKICKNQQIIALSICIFSSLSTCPKIAKRMFVKYWNKMFDILRNFLQLLAHLGSKQFMPFTHTKHSSQIINSDSELTDTFRDLRSICNGLCSHVYRLDLFFTSKHWKYFVKYKLFQLFVKATFYEYNANKFQNKDGVRIDYTGKTIEDCFYMEWFFTAFGLNRKYSHIFKNSYLKSLKSFLTHPRMNYPHFVPKSSKLWLMITPRKNSIVQFHVHKMSKVYWNTYKASKECHSSKCDKIQFYMKGINFKKCKCCQIVVYCSRHCQKFDWSRGNHRLYCKTLRNV
eukprot:463273_1